MAIGLVRRSEMKRIRRACWRSGSRSSSSRRRSASRRRMPMRISGSGKRPRSRMDSYQAVGWAVVGAGIARLCFREPGDEGTGGLLITAIFVAAAADRLSLGRGDSGDAKQEIENQRGRDQAEVAVRRGKREEREC